MGVKSILFLYEFSENRRKDVLTKLLFHAIEEKSSENKDDDTNQTASQLPEVSLICFGLASAHS